MAHLAWGTLSYALPVTCWTRLTLCARRSSRALPRAARRRRASAAAAARRGRSRDGRSPRRGARSSSACRSTTARRPGARPRTDARALAAVAPHLPRRERAWLTRSATASGLSNGEADRRASRPEPRRARASPTAARRTAAHPGAHGPSQRADLTPVERAPARRPVRDRRGARRRGARCRSTATASRRRFVFACEHHADQRRKSGEDFIVHPVGVAKICAGMRLDTETLVAALLHDTVEDTSASLEEVARAVRRGGRGARRRRHQAHRHHLHLARRGAGRELPQDDGRDGLGHPGHPHQARRPPAQHAHDRRDAQAEADREGQGDPRDLRADRAPPRHPRDQVGARGPRVRGAAPAQVPGDQGPGQPAARGARGLRRASAGERAARELEALGIDAAHLRPRQALLLDLLEDDQEGPRVQRDLRPHGHARHRRLGEGLLRRGRRHPLAVEAAARAASRTSSRCRSSTCTSRCTRR